MKLFLCVLVAAVIASAVCEDIADLPALTDEQNDCIGDLNRIQAVLDAGCSLSDLQDIGNMVSRYK